MTDLLLAMLTRQALAFSAAVLLLALLRPLLRRGGAGALYLGWLLVPALVLTPALPRPAAEPLQLALQAAGAPGLPTVPALPARTGDPALPLLLLWLGGTAVVLLAQARRQWRLSRLVGTQGRLPAGSSPALIGLWRPRVALPADFEHRFPPAQRELILAHEQVHRERLDNLWNLLACGLTALHWWNPLAWWAARRWRVDQELACDAAVLASRPEARADYTRALLAAHDLHHLGAPLASRWGTTHPLIERIAMLNHARRLSRLRVAALGGSLLALAGLAYAVQTETPKYDTPLVELKVELSYRTGKTPEFKTESANTTMRVHLGERALLMLHGRPDAPTADQVAVAIVASDLGDNKIDLRTEVSKGNPLSVVARPRLITANGVKARIEQGRNDPADTEMLSLTITPTLMATAKP
ncbi:M56 family metallopeptidase [Roseateles puraquae]|uniref:Peptidase M56 domain-containing protein n=1 Tax=Roseateles puraquae TaxID=431059 RepID=A0A254N6Q8_9BURK|nr:M56 family metallopeptidase [Roseateles puraquae]MDG0853191.1 hypothetical protein [Roseateles puraquae]OWR03699.1 hypothetical protein CDO81_14535 [Roseateles puraquae]